MIVNSRKKVNINILIQNGAILNNYIELIKLLSSKNFSVSLTIEKSISNFEELSELKGIEKHYYKLDKNLAFWEEIFNYTLIGRNRNKSISFEERYIWRTPKFKDFKSDLKGKNIQVFLYRLKTYLLKHYDVLLLKFFLKTKFDFILKPLFYRIFTVFDFQYILRNLKANTIIIVPYWGINTEANFILTSVSRVKSKHFKTLFIQENWDNLSSKSVMYFKPDYLAVWGDQSKNHAIHIQGMEWNRIKILQSPRYIEFYPFWQNCRKNSRPLSRSKEKKIILFIGDSSNMDEVEIIQKVSQFILKNQLNFEILYRPHPFQKSNYKRKFLKETIPINVKLDEEFGDDYFNCTIQKEFSTKANQILLLERLRIADFIICGGSTSFLEAVLSVKPILLINGRLRNTFVLKKEHFRGVEKLDYVKVINEFEIDELELKNFFNQLNDIDTNKFNFLKVDYYFDLGTNSYLKRFEDIIKSL